MLLFILLQKLNFKNRKIAKIPTIIQLEILECAAACLAMILAYYKKFVPLEQLRIDCKVTKHGSNAKNLVIAAQKHGLEAFGVKIEAEELKRTGKFPCIIHWNFNHFVVLAGFKRKKAILHDPASGLNVVDFATFCKGFTGICLNFCPGKNFKAGGKPKTTTKFFIQTLKNSFTAFLFFFIISTLAFSVNLIKPGFFHFLVDKILIEKNKSWALMFAIMMALATLAELTIVWLKTIHFLKIKSKLCAQGNSKFVWRLLHLPLEFFSNRFTGEIQMRQSLNAVVTNQIVSEIAPLILNMANVIVFFIIMLRYSGFLTLTISLTSLVAIMISKFSSKQQLDLYKVKLKNEGRLNALTIAGLASIESIKINGSENQFFQQWADAQATLNSQALKDPFLANLPKLIANLSPKATIVAGAFLLINKQLTLGMIVTFNMFLKMMIKPFSNFLNADNRLQNIKTKIERVEDIMNFKLDNCFSKTQTPSSFSKLSGKIEIKNLKFCHIGENEAILNDFNLKIKPGEKVAIVGPAGCGKTTLAKLLTGILKQQQGQILFDNKKISEIEKAVFRSCVAVVSQKSFFFNDTIKNNLKMWNECVDDLTLIEAAKKAKIYYEIVRHGGFDSKILENAKNFSNGQRQQLEIARALAQQPQILILDEPTCAIDPQTKLQIVEAICKEPFSVIVFSKSSRFSPFCNKTVRLN